ncbi:UNVERIFIED_CONTAM: hypothetical protein GTU68_040437, partial [Idotea baltica]|nr:hypothetical protein [Idotea baltica]
LQVNINERSYFAFSRYEGDFSDSISYCGETLTGWSRDKTVRNWSCFNGTKNTEVMFVPPRASSTLTYQLPSRNYVNNHDFIEKINSIQSSWTAKAYPEYERYTLEEMFRRAGGPGSVIPNPTSPAPATEEQKARAALLPENFDWRDINGVSYVSPVRDQESCGSCYAFASLAGIEARLRIATQNQRQDIFSPQDVVDCSILSQGCDGGFNYLIAGRYAQDQGLVAEECNLYLGVDTECATDTTCSRTYVSDYSYVGGYYGGCNEELMLEALVAGGPYPVSYMVYSDFYLYTSGVYVHTETKDSFNPFVVWENLVLNLI